MTTVTTAGNPVHPGVGCGAPKKRAFRLSVGCALPKPGLRVALIGVVCIGIWQVGQGLWLPAKARLAQALLERAWQDTAAAKQRMPPWPGADTGPLARLTAGDGAVDLIVLAGSSGRTLAFGPGHMSGTVLPGETGNSVIAGHRDTHFRFLRDLTVGDPLTVERADGARFEFRVTALDVVDGRRGSLLIDTPRSLLTLVTCYPFDTASAGGPLRYVVTAARSRTIAAATDVSDAPRTTAKGSSARR